MGSHDDYGKRVVRTAAGGSYQDTGELVEVDYGAGRPARIDGVVGSLVAVEVDSRTAKQVRGAVLDLICHRYPKKLLILIPMHMHDVNTTADQCRNILERFVGKEAKIVVLEGTGASPHLEADAASVRNALAELGWRSKVKL